MYKNYIKVAFRNLFRHRIHSLINILGLSAGLACSIVILIYIQSEAAYDSYHEDADRTYRIGSIFTVRDRVDQFALTSPYLAPLLKDRIEAIESTCRLRLISKLKVTYGDHSGYQEHLMWADSTAFDFFTTEMIYGDPRTCLRLPNRIAISESVSQQYFGDRNPVGDTLITSNRFQYIVSGVFRDLPEETHHRFSGLLSYSTLQKNMRKEDPNYRVGLWSVGDYTFVKLREGYRPEAFMDDFRKFYAEEMANVGEDMGGTYQPALEPITSIHLHSDLEYDAFPSGNFTYIYAFSLIGFFILLLAGINYVNMATARATTREREVGLRKVLGSRKSHLVLQFLGESLMISLFALLIAFSLVEMVFALTGFNELMGKDLRLDLLSNGLLFLGALGITVMLGVLSGLYPAFFMSAIIPARALRRRTTKGGSLVLRKSLVIVQFSVSIGVIICTFLMQDQINYMRTQDLGFETESIAVLAVRDPYSTECLPEIRAEIESLPGVISTTTALGVPAHSIPRRLFRIEEEEGKLLEEVVDYIPVGMDYLPGIGLEVVEGRNFIPGYAPDSVGAYLVNETAAKVFMGGDALGKEIEFGLEQMEGGVQRGKVIGVVQDFRITSFHETMEPLILRPQLRPGGMLHVRMQKEDIDATISSMEELWAESEAAGSPFNPFFINEKFDRLYTADLRQSRLMGILAIICIVISILGLFGFASYTIEMRRREIGIRKVLGASSFRLVRMIIGEVLVLVIISGAIAAILAWLGIQWWLQEYAYRASLDGTTFLWATGIALGTALVTVIGQTLRAALANPVVALKYE